MKIYIRHGTYDKDKLIEGNTFSLLSDAGIQQILAARADIKKACEERGTTLPTLVYSSYEDRAIETALLLLEGQDKRVVASRKEMFDTLRMFERQGIKKRQMYLAVGPRYFEGIQMDGNLERYVPPKIRSIKDDMIVVLHQPSVESLGLRLNEGEFKIVDD